ncbi:MAG: hypothetical protein UW94_C0019G0008 [Parcubacteria group bacterium GW2011_GWA2_45_14]|nr:MAG: hypothetical protein UW94_C0019G0008 [Parcubacteria group bacterium GW2011_GWA2_45_14]
MLEKGRIINMRRKGFSIGEIASVLKRGKSTIVRHVKGVTVSSAFYDTWKVKRGGSHRRATERRRQSYDKVLSKIGGLTERDMLIIAACLYWGEGNKKEFNISNTDPYLIETFLECLKKLGIAKSRLKFSIRIYEDIDQREAKRYWARLARIKPSDILSVNVLSGKKVGKLPYGMCRIRLTKGNDYFNLITATIRLISGSLAPIAQRIERRTPKP